VLISSSPTPDELKAQELDFDIIPEEDVKLELTNRAAEQLKSIAMREHCSNAGLRIAVESGGCHGYQYTMELASERNAEDYHFTHPAIIPSNIYIDAVSLGLLNGSTIDFATELIGSSFRIAANPQAKGGCGCGISWEMKD
jgi:iron-sulfur cluster assembly accessory protein